MQGNAYGIKLGDDFIPCEISCELIINREMINKSGSGSGKFRKYRYGYIDWSVTMDAKSVISILSGGINNLITSQLGGQELELMITARVSNVDPFDVSGTVLIPNLSLTLGGTGQSTHSVTFQGSGALQVEAGMIGYLTTDGGTYITDNNSNKIQVIKNI